MRRTEDGNEFSNTPRNPQGGHQCCPQRGRTLRTPDGKVSGRLPYPFEDTSSFVHSAQQRRCATCKPMPNVESLHVTAPVWSHMRHEDVYAHRLWRHVSHSSGKQRQATLPCASTTERRYEDNRPKQGLMTKGLQTRDAARAISLASMDIRACKEDFLVHIRSGSNIIVLNTANEKAAELILKNAKLDFQGTEYQVSTYVSTPVYFLKGAIHDIDEDTSEAELMANLHTRTLGVNIVRARVLGKSDSHSSFLWTDGPEIYTTTEGKCNAIFIDPRNSSACGTAGHRTVCPKPTTVRCMSYGTSEHHTCKPKCALCSGGHTIASQERRKRFKRIQRQRKQTKIPAESRGILLSNRRWLSAEL